MQEITLAITQRRVMTITYDGGGARSIEPHCFGVSKKGNELLRAYQIGGDSEEGNRVEWKLFSVDKITAATVTAQTFRVRADYNPDDPAMDRIYCAV